MWVGGYYNIFSLVFYWFIIFFLDVTKPKQEPEKNLNKRPSEAKDAREVAKKLIKTGAIRYSQYSLLIDRLGGPWSIYIFMKSKGYVLYVLNMYIKSLLIVKP